MKAKKNFATLPVKKVSAKATSGTVTSHINCVYERNKMANSIQDRPPNFRGGDGKLYLVRCFACDKDIGVENYTMAVASGQCSWCGWKEDKDG